MKKIPCVFLRDYSGPRDAPVTRSVTPGCEWVLTGEGVATQKWDGTAVLIQGGKLYARYDAKKGKTPPIGALPCTPEADPVTGHWPHWIEVTNPPQPQFRYIFEAAAESILLTDGTYEACGPKIGANPQRLPEHALRRHGHPDFPDAPRDFDGLQAYLALLDAEGIVFHHPDGRMAKIRRTDFGLAWNHKAAEVAP